MLKNYKKFDITQQFYISSCLSVRALCVFLSKSEYSLAIRYSSVAPFTV